MPAAELSFWLVRYVLEARKRNGEPYPPNSLHHSDGSGEAHQVEWPTD